MKELDNKPNKFFMNKFFFTTFFLIFFLLSSCSEIQNKEAKICYVDPDLHINFPNLDFNKYIKETISRKNCKSNDVLVIRSYTTHTTGDHIAMFSNPVEYYCRLDREIITETYDDKTIKLKCVLNSEEERSLRY